MNDAEKLKEFVDVEKPEIDELMRKFVGLFNKCGKRYDNEKVQLGVLATIIVSFFKCCPQIGKKQKKKLLKNIIKQL